MAFIGYNIDMEPASLNQTIAALLPSQLDGLYALLLQENRYSITRHIPAASFTNWMHGIIFGDSLQIVWRMSHSGHYRVSVISELPLPIEPQELSFIRDAEPASIDLAEYAIGEARMDSNVYWFSPLSSKPLDYPVPGKGTHVCFLTRSYTLPDHSRITRLRGITEC